MLPTAWFSTNFEERENNYCYQYRINTSSARKSSDVHSGTSKSVVDAHAGVTHLLGYVTPEALAFDFTGCEIVDLLLHPRGTLNPTKQVAVYVRTKDNTK